MKKLLIATDGSPAAQAAVTAGVELAESQGASVALLHVVDPIDVRVQAAHRGYDLTEPPPDAESDDILTEAATVAEAHGVEYELELRVNPGLTVETILAVADEIDAELIAVGSNRHGAIATAFFGSVSHELLKRARRPVLVVHPTPARLYAEAGA
jgi:nucleotide-binding universal stress UspA family protein